MVKVIQDLWILTEAGIVLFNRVYDPKVSAQLFGALMTALDSYSKEIGMGHGGINNFEIKNKWLATVDKVRTALLSLNGDIFILELINMQYIF